MDSTQQRQIIGIDLADDAGRAFDLRTDHAGIVVQDITTLGPAHQTIRRLAESYSYAYIAMATDGRSVTAWADAEPAVITYDILRA